VGDFAAWMVRFYTEKAGYGAGTVQALQASFKEYWPARRTRPFCASWFAVQLDRAHRGSYPTPRDCLDKVRAVRRKIDALPADDRAWTLLWLYGDCQELVDEKELVQICRELGPQKLLLMLRGAPPSQDPDIQPDAANPGSGWRGYRCTRMSEFVLLHARDLLSAEDAGKIHGLVDAAHYAYAAVAVGELQRQNAAKVTAQFWIGVVFLILAGLLMAHNLQRFVRGRYRAEWLAGGVMKGLMAGTRWYWASILAVGAILFFLGAFWLAKYALSQ
jgi:hypothetical protein